MAEGAGDYGVAVDADAGAELIEKAPSEAVSLALSTRVPAQPPEGFAKT
jgi:hypothetical protein